ncbi:hypothetical protein BCV72DRAFT_335283 [Rhizopus microsporus var. microsporus]|uniref:F-box domain-containing protein n=2 Tax=Rhizopus microsporus TaxID=58291 RepID=A0A2G4T1J0_RHIZD|nr:uncharacterized protein RHIMIDRAFT_312062 [Rhizopus microsporus ATCC 52813]ORE07241.1 hypothetical protein BCV72DRAFT_335283 [Rhizopus microsporus var. microsporus]PHZ14869.1 hypothetical protein RHIMIDRAFT_312062 [Rhizopus microsporus ATCC 52813]
MVDIQHFPHHILEIIFLYLTSQEDLHRCRRACSKWHSVATRRLFKRVVISRNLTKFLKLRAMNKSTRLISLGECVKEMYVRMERSMSLEEFKQLVTYCPNVESINVSSWLYLICISKHLLDIDDDIKWSLRHIVANDSNNPSIDVYLKYKDSIVSIHAPSDVKDLQFLASFPSLQTFIHQSSVIQSLREFMFIFDACPKLTHLCIQTTIEDASCLITNQNIYPSLTNLEMKITFSSMTRPMVDYISTRFINLSTVILNIHQTNSSSFEENYTRLVNTLMTPYKRRFSFKMTLKDCRRPFDGNTQMEFTRMLAKCTIEAFKLQPRTFNSMEVTKVDYEPGIHIYVDKKLYCMLFTWAPFSYLIDQDALSGGAIPRYLHKLTFQRRRATLTPFRNDGSPTQIQELNFFYKLRSFQNYYYNSLQTLSLSSVFVDASFFPTLRRICPKLKVLELGMGPIIVYGNEGVIDMQDLRLQRLNLAILPWDFSGNPWLVVVKTHKEYVYIKIHKNRRYNVLTYEEAMEEERQTQFHERYHIYCYDIQEVFRFNRKITLYSNSTSSNIA